MNYTTHRLSAAGEALRKTLGRPLAFALVVASCATLLAVLAFAAIGLWRLMPLQTPPWAQPEALVYFGGAEGEIDLAAAGLALRQVPLVASADFIGRDAALAELTQRHELAPLALRELRPNPLPDAFLVRFAPGATPEAVEAAVVALGKVKNVGAVQYQAAPFRKLAALTQLGRRLAPLSATFLVAVAAMGVLLASVFWCRIDLEELRILHLLGADAASLRRPYVYAGALCLGLAALLVWGVLNAMNASLEPYVTAVAQQYSLALVARPVPAWAGAAFVLAAAFIGAALASIFVRLAQWRQRNVENRG